MVGDTASPLVDLADTVIGLPFADEQSVVQTRFATTALALFRASLGENLEPRHLVNWTRVAYNADRAVPFDDFAGMQPWRLDAVQPAAAPAIAVEAAPAVETDLLREEVRRLILEELKELTRQ